MAYYILTDHPPFEADTPIKVMFAHAHNEEGVPAVRRRKRDVYDPWWTPEPTPRSRRGPGKPKSKGTRLSYTPPPWRGGPE